MLERIAQPPNLVVRRSSVPNGNHEFNRDAAETWFSPLRQGLDDFASRHQLHIVKYYHDSPCWSLVKAHPTGGLVKIDIFQTDQDDVHVGATWYLDDVAAATRWLHSRPSARRPRNVDALLEHLEQELTGLLNTPSGAWTMRSDLII